MRLDFLRISDFKNLRDVQIDFDEDSPYTVLVGANGSGKSNLLEAITLIFRHLDLEIEAPFTYELRYRCRSHDLWVSAEQGHQPRFQSKPAGQDAYSNLSRRLFMSEDDQGSPVYRPAFVFGYYSGPSTRLSSLFERHRERFYDWIIKSRAARSRSIDANSLRRLFYAQTVHGQFALLAFFMGGDKETQEDREFLREHLQIDDLDSVLFVLNRPPWRRSGGDLRFWNAEGDVREFLSRLYRSAMLPARMKRRIFSEIARKPAMLDTLYLFLPNADALSAVYEAYGDQYAFFTAIESTYLSELLGEVRTRVRVTSDAGGTAVTYRDLSEGEQQLLLVLGLLKFTARDEALFLLDEPDTHLNPVWSTQYLDFLSRFIRGRETCHIVMSTHDPLVFAGLQRSEVRILRRGENGAISIDVPDQDPRGMGVAAILTSDLFGLRSSLDSPTQAELDRQRALAVQDNLDDTEAKELEELGTRLSDLGFTQTVRDPLYGLFIEEWGRREDPAWRESVQLTPDQREARSVLARQIVDELRDADTAKNAR